MMKLFIPLMLFLSITCSYAQTAAEGNILLWSSKRKLTADDFLIKVNNPAVGASLGQFSMDYSVNGFDFLTKDFTNKIRNTFTRSASMLNVAYGVEASLRYQQTLFDLCEVYTRRFRKTLKENRGKLGNGTQYAGELNQQVVTELANRRASYEVETKSGTIADKQLLWEATIQRELAELAEYARKEQL